ncbi:competence/damage-inducible protein A [Allomuricauda sp. NBRC 101325]|uniref:competence/damage-inducible protein A n=1 Tax=Allomuricauda sp. NBRC 101325 TaxID=1113758 RepID=UPI0024A51ACE|nr:competence/damage-inducible protein A [Muricauda sp. NBRC 101325]GLU45617.1 CinA-like protein [Muricauda sp. NBRC 101325]
MQAEIITIGDEILIGQIIDSNSAFISKALNEIGVAVYQITSVQDNQEHILQALEEAGSRSSVVIITGGLGPTKDDITKKTLCQFLDDELVSDAAVWEHIQELFKKHINTPISDLNKEQAMVPSRATVLHNAFGTAPGMWMKKGDTVFVSLPGVPYEMKNLIKELVLPKIVEEFDRPHIVHRTVLTYGMGESALADKLEDWENNLPSNIKLAYLPNFSRVKLRLSSTGKDKQTLENAIESEIKKLYQIIGDIIYGEEENGEIEVQVGNMLAQKKLTLATAESFTGGSIAQAVTSVPGASNYFKGSVVCYATEVKINLLGVPEELIEKHSVVSEEVAVSMAENVKSKLGSDFAIATTGNAGPTKGDSDADVGTVYIGISTPNGTYAQKFSMGRSRERVVRKSVNKAFELLYKEILNF